MTDQGFIRVGSRRMTQNGRHPLRRRPMEKCYIHDRDRGRYMALYVNSEIIAKNWTSIVAEISLSQLRIRAATPDDIVTHVLRGNDPERPERPHYVISAEDLGRIVIRGGRAETETPRFKNGWFYINFPQEVSFTRA